MASSPCHPQVAFIVGVLEFVFGVLRLGWVTQLLSNAVIVGFTSGAGIIIALSQVRCARAWHCIEPGSSLPWQHLYSSKLTI
jgi:hypothetical protein